MCGKLTLEKCQDAQRGRQIIGGNPHPVRRKRAKKLGNGLF